MPTMSKSKKIMRNDSRRNNKEENNRGISHRGILMYSSLIWDNIWSHSHELTSILSKNFHIYYLEVPKNSAKGHEHLISKNRNPLPKNVTLLTPKKSFSSFGPAYMLYTQKESIRFFLKHVNDFDIFITYNTYDIALLNLAKAFKKKILFMYVDEYEELTPNKFFRSYIARNVRTFLKKADAVVCTARILEKKARALNKNVYYLPNAVRLADFKSLKHVTRKEAKQKKSHSGNEFIVGYVGALGNWIDVDMIADTAKSLQNTHPNITFQIIGSGPGEKILQDRMSREHINNIRLFGFVYRTDALKMMTRFDVAIIPFKINTITQSVSPLKLFDYWMTGNAVITTKTAELKQFSGELALVGNTKEMKESIISLSKNNDKLDALAAKGKKIVLERYNWERYESIYLDIIRKVL